MRLSFFPIALLLLAAGSESKAGRRSRTFKRQQECPSNTTAEVPSGSSAAPATSSSATTGGGTGDGTDGGQGGIELAGSSEQDGSNSTTSVPSTGGGSCIPGFKNTVFNTGVVKMGGWPGKTWESLSNAGVVNWIGFSQDPYEGANDAVAKAQIPILMDKRYLDEALRKVKGVDGVPKPAYLELYNEPDFSFQGFTPLTDPLVACDELAPFFSEEVLSQKETKYIAPSPAYANGPDAWLQKFAGKCGDYFQHIDVLSLHVYNSDPAFVVGEATKLHDAYGKPVWITELAPEGPDQCPLDPAGVIKFMQDVAGKLRAEAPFVEKIFWNCGEAGGVPTGLAGGGCNPSLTNDDGSPTALLDAYAKLTCE